MGTRYPLLPPRRQPERAAKGGGDSPGPRPATSPPTAESGRGSCTSGSPTSPSNPSPTTPRSTVIWEKFQETLEPLRTELNAALGRSWGGVGDPPGSRRPVAGGRRCGVERHPERAHRRREGGGAIHPESRPGPKLHPGRRSRPNPATRGIPAPPICTAGGGKRASRASGRFDASIAARAEFEYLYDRPCEDRNTVRTAGPFTVESLSPHRTLGVDENDELIDKVADAEGRYGKETEEAGFTAMILENLKTSGVQQAHKEDRIAFTSLFPWPGHFVLRRRPLRRRRRRGRRGRHRPRETRRDLRRPRSSAPCPVRIWSPPPAKPATPDSTCSSPARSATDAPSSDFDKLGRIPVLKARMNADLHMAGDLKNTGKGNPLRHLRRAGHRHPGRCGFHGNRGF